MRGQHAAISRLQCARPAPEGAGACATEPGRSLCATHPGVEEAGAGGAAVVVHEDHERVFRDAPFVELGEHLADVLVDVVDHAEEAGGLIVRHLAIVKRLVLGAGNVGTVRRVGRDIGEERLAGLPLRVHPLGCLGIEDIGAVALGLHERAVVEDGRVEILVPRGIAATAGVGLPDAARAVDEHLGEAPPTRPILRFVAEMPFAEDAGGVAGPLEHLRQGGGLEGEPLAFEDGVGDAVLELMPAREERAAGRGAGGADVEVGEAHALGADAVEVGCLEDGVPVGGDVPVALVVGEKEDDVRPLVGKRGEGRSSVKANEQNQTKPQQWKCHTVKSDRARRSAASRSNHGRRTIEPPQRSRRRRRDTQSPDNEA